MGFESTFTVDNWHREARTAAIRDRIKTRRWGMRVTVYDDSDPSLNGEWVLTFGLVDDNRQSNDNWLKVADIGSPWGGGGGITASNGLTLSGDDVRLGGTLDDYTVVDAGPYNISFTGSDGTNFVGLDIGSSLGGYAGDTAGYYTGFGTTKTNFNVFANDTNFNAATFNVDAEPAAIRMQISNQDNGSTFNLNQFGLIFTTSQFSTDTYAEFEILNSNEITILSGGPGFVKLAGIYIHTADTIDLIAETFQLNSVASSDPTNEFFRADGTWAVPAGGGGVTFGLVNQIPYVNASADDFDYEAGFEYVPADDRLFVGNIRLGSDLIAGNRIIDFRSSDVVAQLQIGNVVGNQGTITFLKSQSDVRVHSSLSVYSSAAHTSIAGQMGGQTRLGATELGVWSYGTFGVQRTVGNGTGVLNTLRGGDVTATTGNSSTSGSVLISPGSNVNATSNGNITSGDVLINSPAPFNSGVHGNLSIFNNTYSASPDWQGGQKIIFIGNRVAAPSGDPANGGYLYVENGALVFHGSAGTVTVIAPA